MVRSVEVGLSSRDERPATLPPRGGLLAPERNLAITLVLANAALAAAGFLGPLLFGSIGAGILALHADRLAPASSRCTPTGWRSGDGWPP